MTLQALIFDVDGTLAETEEAHRRAFNDTFAEFGLDWRWSRALYRQLLKTTGGKERMRAYVTDHLGGDAAQIPVAEIHRRKTARYGELISQGSVGLRPGVEALIRDATNKGCRLAVATTTNVPNVDGLVRATLGVPAQEVFEVIAAGDMVTAKKPAPDVYQLALGGLKLPASTCLALEDSENGLKSARAAGIACLVCPSAYTDHDDFSGAAALVQSYEEISSLEKLAAATAGLSR